MTMDDNLTFPVEPEATDKLYSRLVLNAERLGLLDVAYRYIDTPVGTLLLAATQAGFVRVAFACEDFEAVLEGFATHISPWILYTPQRLDAAAPAIEEYFAGRRQDC